MLAMSPSHSSSVIRKTAWRTTASVQIELKFVIASREGLVPWTLQCREVLYHNHYEKQLPKAFFAEICRIPLSYSSDSLLKHKSTQINSQNLSISHSIAAFNRVCCLMFCHCTLKWLFRYLSIQNSIKLLSW